MPEGIVFIHIQDSGNSHGTSGSLIGIQRRIGEEPLKLIFKKVRYIVCIFLSADTALTAVAGDELSATGKLIDGKSAVVGATLTLCHTGFILEGAEFFVGKHIALVAVFVTFSCNQCSAEGTHDAGNIGTDGFAACDFFKAAQHGIIIEGTALNNDILAEL